MEIEPVLPRSPGEWLAWLSALTALVGGIATFLMPRTIMRATGLAPADGRRFGYSEIRGPLGGFYIGTALVVLLLHPQPLLYLLLGTAFAFACFGRIVSAVFDRVLAPQHFAAIAGDAALAAAPLLYVFGVIA